MNWLALLFALFFTGLCIGFALLCKLRNSWNPTAYLALGFMALAALIFWLTTFLRSANVQLIICFVLAAAVLLYAIVDFVKKKKAGNYHLHQAIYTLLYLALIVILLLRAFRIYLT